MKTQRGGFAMGLVVGLLLGLILALGVALYVTKVPVALRQQGAAAHRRTRRRRGRAQQALGPERPAGGQEPGQAESGGAAGVSGRSGLGGGRGRTRLGTLAERQGLRGGRQGQRRRAGGLQTGTRPRGPAGRRRRLGRRRVGAEVHQTGPRPVHLFRAGRRFGRDDDAEQQRAKLAMLGFTARVTEREQAGRTVYRVRMGPFEAKDEAEAQQERLQAAGQEAALVRVQRQP